MFLAPAFYCAHAAPLYINISSIIDEKRVVFHTRSHAECAPKQTVRVPSENGGEWQASFGERIFMWVVFDACHCCDGSRQRHNRALKKRKLDATNATKPNALSRYSYSVDDDENEKQCLAEERDNGALQPTNNINRSHQKIRSHNWPNARPIPVLIMTSVSSRSVFSQFSVSFRSVQNSSAYRDTSASILCCHDMLRSGKVLAQLRLTTDQTHAGCPLGVLGLKTHQQWHRSSPMLNFTQNYFVITSIYYIGMSVRKKECGKYHIHGEIYVFVVLGISQM